MRFEVQQPMAFVIQVPLQPGRLIMLLRASILRPHILNSSHSRFQLMHRLQDSRLTLTQAGKACTTLCTALCNCWSLARPELGVQVHSQPSDMQGLAQWLTQRHDRATALQSSQLDALYRLLAAAAALAQPAAQEALLRRAIEAHFCVPETDGSGADEAASSGQVQPAARIAVAGQMCA